MSIFQEVGLKWKGQEYVVPPDKVMGLVEVVEDVITIEELVGNGIKRVRLAKAFAAAIRYAAQCKGAVAKIDDQEVFESLFGDDAMATTTRTVHALLAFMIPPEHLQVPSKDVVPGAKKKRAARKKAVKGSSRKRT